MGTQLFTDTLTVVACCRCGIAFGITQDFERRRLDDHASFYCPAGHLQAFNAKSEAERLREELERTNKTVAWLRTDADAARRDRDSATRQARAFKGVATRIKKRIKHGVCPCCNRTFANVAAHMETKHPNYASKDSAPSAS